MINSILTLFRAEHKFLICILSKSHAGCIRNSISATISCSYCLLLMFFFFWNVFFVLTHRKYYVHSNKRPSFTTLLGRLQINLCAPNLRNFLSESIFANNPRHA